jgi:RNA polymerase sigma-32 factor
MTEPNNSSILAYQVAFKHKFPQLDRAAELEVARRWRKHGDRNAAEALTRPHLRTVFSLALKYRHFGVPTADLIAEGNFGLVHALGKFDPERGVRFVTYAAHWIRAFMVAYALRSGSVVGGTCGPRRSQIYFRLRRERARVTAMFGEGPAANEELARRMGMPLSRLQPLLDQLDARDVSLDQPIATDASTSLLDRIVATSDPEEQCSQAQLGGSLGAAVHRALAVLNQRERFIVEMRLMAPASEELSLAEIGRRLGVSRERARQLEARAKQRLQTRLASETAVTGR